MNISPHDWLVTPEADLRAKRIKRVSPFAPAPSPLRILFPKPPGPLRRYVPPPNPTPLVQIIIQILQ